MGRRPHGNRQAARETVAETLEARVERLDSSDAELIERPPPNARHHRRQGCGCSAYSQIASAPRLQHYVANTRYADPRPPGVRILPPAGSAPAYVATRRQLGNIAPRAQDPVSASLLSAGRMRNPPQNFGGYRMPVLNLSAPCNAARLIAGPFAALTAAGLVHGVALAATLPTAPKTFDTTYAAPTGATLTVAAGGDLRAALDQAKLGDTIVLEAGA